MNYLKPKANIFIALFIAGICCAACNSGNSDNATSDTSTAMYTPESTDTAKMSTSADTSNMSPNYMTDTLAKTTKPATTSTRKKGKATVVLLPEVKNRKVKMDKAGVYDYSEVMPSFPGGQSSIENYITNNIEYPQPALDEGKEGKVNVAFTVDENGKVTDAHIVSNKLGDGLDEEAVKVVSAMPKWTPGTVKGKPVKARVTLPITFQIEQ